VAKDADYIGLDNQIDTYFQTGHGRLKLREGSIENHLIYYVRKDRDSPKISDVVLYNTNDQQNLKAILVQALGVKICVEKRREIYFIDHVKFHLDDVKGLGSFVEIEVIDLDRNLSLEKMHDTCTYYMSYLGIGPSDLLSRSYSDMLLEG